jgi:hypothetical protein
VRERRTFWRRAVSEGLLWARGVLHEVAALIALVLVTTGVTVGGLLLHRPAWFLGVFGVVLLLVVLGEGAYRVWNDAETRAQALPEPIGISLLDRLRLALKRGETLQSQAKLVPTSSADAGFLSAAHDWYEGIHKLLIEGGAKGEANRWLDETEGTPAAAQLDISNLLATSHAIEGQVTYLKAIIGRLEAEQ